MRSLAKLLVYLNLLFGTLLGSKVALVTLVIAKGLVDFLRGRQKNYHYNENKSTHLSVAMFAKDFINQNRGNTARWNAMQRKKKKEGKKEASLQFAKTNLEQAEFWKMVSWTDENKITLKWCESKHFFFF